MKSFRAAVESGIFTVEGGRTILVGRWLRLSVCCLAGKVSMMFAIERFGRQSEAPRYSFLSLENIGRELAREWRAFV